MKNILIFSLLICITFTACNLENRKPVFKRVENLQVKNISSTLIAIEADVVIYNPNGVSIYINKIDVELFANEVKVSNITQTKKAEVSKSSEFKIPLNANLKLMDLIKDESSILNIINSGLNAYKDKKIDLKFNGTAEFEVAGVKFDIPIEHEEVVNLK